MKNTQNSAIKISISLVIDLQPPQPGNALPDPREVTATYYRESKTLTVSCSVYVPSDTTSLIVHQYFNPRSKAAGGNELIFTVHYDSSGSESAYVPITWNAKSEEYLASIEQVSMILHDDDPKTSRGTVTTVSQAY